VAKSTNIIWGTCYDPSLENKICVTIIATGFETNSIPELYHRKKPTSKITLTELTSNAKPTDTPFEIKDKSGREFKSDEIMTVKKAETSRLRMTDKEKQFELFNENEEHGKRKINIDPRRAAERVKQIKSSQEKMKESFNAGGNDNIENLENEPAFVRKKILIEDTKHSSEANVSKYTLSDDPENQSRISPDNPYLHDNVD
jgi:cell division protein FtsZ